MEGLIAVLGFWVFMIALIVRKPIAQFIELRKTKGTNEEMTTLCDRVRQLEGAVVTMGKDIQEVKDTSEFAHKLLIDSAQQIADAHRLLTHNANQLAEAQVLIANHQPDAPKREVKVLPNPTQEPKRLTAGTPLINELGKIIGDGTVRFERVLAAPIERVWQYLTDPDCLSLWLASGSIEQRFGGKVELHFDVDEVPERVEKGARIQGNVTFIEPLRTLAYSWNEPGTELKSNVCFQLSERGDETSLVITHGQLPHSRMQDVMAGWHTHLDILKARFADMTPPLFRKRYREVLQTYAAVVATTIVVSSTIAAPAAVASPNPDTYQAIQVERSRALSRYDSLVRDTDDLKREIARLKGDTSSEASHAADKLEQQLDDENRNLHDLELQIRDLDNAMR